MRLLYRILFSAYLLVCCHIALAQDQRLRRIDSLLRILSDHDKYMGSVTLSYQDTIRYQRTLGFSFINKEQRVPAPPNALYRVGSVSKVFTAIMILQLCEEKKLDTATLLSTFYPKVPNASKITISMLLNHHSGIPNFSNDPDYKYYMLKPRKKEEMLNSIYTGKSRFTPGTKAEYSNSNYLLLGYIIERITGFSFDANLQERICKRAGLTDTYVMAYTDTSKRQCYSYRYAGTWAPQPETDPTVPGAAGNIESTSQDLDQMMRALFSFQLLDSQSVSMMTRLQDQFGYGIFNYRLGNHEAWGHTGGIDGFSNIIAYFPEDKVGIACTANAIQIPINDILIGVLSLWHGLPYEFPDFRNIRLSHETLFRYAGVYDSEQFLASLTFTETNGILYMQAKGQQSVPLIASTPTQFRFEPAGIYLEFDPDHGKMYFKQNGAIYTFNKKPLVTK